MEVKVAEFSGFCFGVERAISLVDQVIGTSDDVATFGPIIHNPQVVKSLEERGVNVIKSVSETDKSKTVVVRSHGVELNEYNMLKERSHNIIDATCPFVKKAQIKAKELSEKCDAVVLLGEADHPEVKGIISYATGEIHLIESEDEAKKLDFRKSYGFLAQTTQNNMLFLKISDILKDKCEELSIAKTICNATDKRQKASVELAANVDVMIVIGGRNSANTTRLYHLCKEICCNTYHVETTEEISVDMLAEAKTVGITAGASTPGYLVSEVREYILEVSR